MSTVRLFFNRTYLDDVEDPEVTEGVPQRHAIGGGRYIPGRAAPATVSIPLGADVRARVATARSTDELLLVTAHGAIYQLFRSVLLGNILTAEIEPAGMVRRPG